MARNLFSALHKRVFFLYLRKIPGILTLRKQQRHIHFNGERHFPGIMANPQFNFTYLRSVFEHPSKWYDSYQENGTKYLKSRKKLDQDLQAQLNACNGEIFLSGIPGETRAEKVAEIASQLGEVYVLRFKVNFSGDSRGFAYLQYMNPSLMQLAINRLPQLFRQNSLPTLRVRQSRNSSILLLRKTYRMTPKMVFETLTSMISFHLLVGREIYPGYFEYQIIFKCNEEAVHARRELLRTITKFGRNAVVVWDNVHNLSNTHYRNNGNSAYANNSLDLQQRKSYALPFSSQPLCRPPSSSLLAADKPPTLNANIPPLLY